MKKTFKLLAIAFAAMSMGTVMTSCSEDGSGGFLSRIFNLFNNDTYTYTGQAVVYTMSGSSNTNTWNRLRNNDAVINNATVTINSSSSTASIALPTPITDGDVTITEVVIYDLALNNSDATKTTFDFGENTSIVGKLKIGNDTYDAKNLYIAPDKTYATTTNISLELQVYFDDNEDGDYTKVMSISYEGVGQTE